MMAMAMPSAVVVAVPSLDDLARDPSLAGALPRHTAAALVAAGLVVVSAAAGRLLVLSAEPAAGRDPDRDAGREPVREWLDAERVEVMFGLNPMPFT